MFVMNAKKKNILISLCINLFHEVYYSCTFKSTKFLINVK